MIIYKVTNRINGMVYIGQTKNSLQRRWKQHINNAKRWYACHKLQAAINEFGPERFLVEEIDSAGTVEEALEKEAYWIQVYNSAKYGYNVSPGGKGGGHRHKVMSVETGKVYETEKVAAKDVGRSFQAINQALDKPHLTAAGQHWISVK